MTCRFHINNIANDIAPQIPTALPPISVGTPKQRAAAERIRQEYVRGANDALMWWLGHTDDGETSTRRALGLLMTIDEARLIAEAVTDFASGPYGTDATMWLDYYKVGPYESGRMAVAKFYCLYPSDATGIEV